MSGLQSWQLNAAEQQQCFYNQFGDRRWDKIPMRQTTALNTKISFTLYSTPYENCSFDQKKTINATREKVIELSGSGDVHFGCVFVNVLPSDTRESYIVPLIRTKQTYGDDVYFVEKQPGRVYTGWTDYLEENKLPSGHMCYPANGFYLTRFNQRVNIEFQEISGKSVVGTAFDIASSVAKTASIGLITAALFFPVTTPFVIGATAALGVSTTYTTTRAIIDVVDHKNHHESVGADVWIGIGVEVITAVLAGGVAVLPRLVASGRLASSMASTVMDVLNWVSVGMNSFGVLANVAILIGKLRDGTLDSTDITYFISSCLFISNIVVNAVIAEKVIQSISNRPSQLVNIFKMTSNTTYCAIKTISVVGTSGSVIEMICGDMVVAFVRHFGMNHFAQFLQGVKGLLRQFRRGIVNIWSLCFKLQQLLSCHLMEVVDEVSEAWKEARAFFSTFDFPGGIFTTPSIEAAELVNNAERVLDEANIHDEMNRVCTRDAVMRAALEMARNMNAETEREFANLGQMAMNDIRRRFDRSLVVAASQGEHSYERNRRDILLKAVREFKDEFETNVEALETNADTALNNDLRLIPLTTSEDIDAYVFQVPYRVPQFDQFIYDAACHLLRDDDFLDHCRIESGHEPVVVIQSLGSTLIFHYEQLEDSDTAIGMVFLKN